MDEGPGLSGRLTSVVADDHPAIVGAVSEVLVGQGIEVCGRACEGAEAVALIRRHAPGIAVVDARMPRLSGIEVVREVVRSQLGTAIVLYTAHDDRGTVTEAIAAGARGFVSKGSPLDELVRAVEVVAAGGLFVDPGLAHLLLVPGPEVSGLTQRELEVLRLLADGLDYKRIGSHLSISPETVRTHAGKVMAKRDARSRTQAVATALRQRLIE